MSTRDITPELMQRGPIFHRFWSKAKVRDRNDCWLWTGTKGGGGYGRFTFEGQWQSAHRVAYKMHVGEIPDGLFVCHRCDVRLCVNPSHLFLGTARDNTHDMMSKGRGWWVTQPGSHSNGVPPVHRGSENPAAVLTETQVLEIRALNKGGIGCQKLARRFGVGKTTIKQINRRQTWAHLPEKNHEPF